VNSKLMQIPTSAFDLVDKSMDSASIFIGKGIRTRIDLSEREQNIDLGIDTTERSDSPVKFLLKESRTSTLMDLESRPKNDLIISEPLSKDYATISEIHLADH